MFLQCGINSSQWLKAIVSPFPDMCNACVHCQPCPALSHKVVPHSCPLIYVPGIKRHGLYRSAVTFLYSHRHSWGTAGWSGKRFMAQTQSRVLKTLASGCCPPPKILVAPFASLPPSVVQPKHSDSEMGQPIPVRLPKIESHSTFGHSVGQQLPVGDNENMDTTDTLWLFVAESCNRAVFIK